MGWYEEQLAFVLGRDYNFYDEDQAAFENHIIDAENYVMALAKRENSDNIKIKFDPAEVIEVPPP